MNFGKIKKLNPLEGYNRWAQSYAHESNPIKKYSDELIQNWLVDVKGKSVLDVGCGAGWLCALAKQKGASKIVGTDFSQAMVDEAKKKVRDVELKCVDLSKEGIEGVFDFVVCSLVLGHISNLDFALNNLINNLSPDGVLLITDFHPFQTLKGAKRTFNDEKTKRKFEVEHHLHLFEKYFTIASKSRAHVDELMEPCWKGEPVVFGMKIRKQKS
jgi:malonyl-CoA O-methyltransferase